MSHKFSLGEAVIFAPGADEILKIATTGTISRLLPKEGAEYQYHFQFGTTGQQRRVQENQLRPFVRPA